jgi:hypothetical protein
MLAIAVMARVAVQVMTFLMSFSNVPCMFSPSLWEIALAEWFSWHCLLLVATSGSTGEDRRLKVLLKKGCSGVYRRQGSRRIGNPTVRVSIPLALAPGQGAVQTMVTLINSIRINQRGSFS